MLLDQEGALVGWDRWERAYSSELLSVEARRAIDRLRLDGAFDDERTASVHEALRSIEASIGLVHLSRPILRRAALPMSTVVRTLESIHIASALALQENRQLLLVFATHDPQQAIGARALGLECIGT